jgi:hypothetical protein
MPGLPGAAAEAMTGLPGAAAITTEAVMTANLPDPLARESQGSGPRHRQLEAPARPLTPRGSPHGRRNRTVMRQQVIDLILDIISATDPQSAVRLRLVRHLAAHPGCPEQALLCHLLESSRHSWPPAASPIEAK